MYLLNLSFTHLSDDALDAQLLRDNHRRLLSNDQRSRVRICCNVSRANRQIRNFESLDAIDVQARVDDAASLSRFHRASAELAQNKNNKRQKKPLIRQLALNHLGERAHRMPGRAHL